MEKARLLQELGVDVRNGIIPLIGEVGEEMFARLVLCINTMANSGLEYDQLTILLNTYGGDLYQAFAIYDFLKFQSSLGIKVRIVCNGPVMSAGTIILMAGDVREMTKKSYLMLHYGEDVNSSESELKHNVRILKDMKDIYKNNSKVTPKMLNEWFSSTVYYNAEEALAIGLVDKVVNYAEKTEKKSATRSRR